MKLKYLRELSKISRMSEQDILLQVSEDYDAWYFHVENKREKFEADLKLYNNQKKNKDKIGDTTVYNIHSSLLARLYMWKVQTVFEWTLTWIEQTADNLQSMYTEDFEEDAIAQIEYQRLWDMLFYGVGITAKVGWDWQKKCTKFQNVDPRDWIPDPDGDYAAWEYRFAGFEKLFTKQQLKNMGIWNEDLIPVDISGTSYKWPDKTKKEDQKRGGLNTYNGKSRKGLFSVFMYFGEFEWERAIVWTGNENKLIIWASPLKAVYDYEKENSSKIPFPFDFTYYRPLRGDCFGKSVVDDTGDVQRAKAIIANLRLDKSMAELYPMYMYNTRMLKNKSDLDFGFNKLIAVNPLEWEPLDNAIQPLRKDFRADNSYLIENSLDQQVERATSIGALAQGSDPQRRETATTNKILQGNTDININLTARRVATGTRNIAKLWLRGILENFTAWDTKKVRIYNGISYFPNEIKKSDILHADKIKIIVKSEAEVSEKRQKEINAFNMALPILQASWIPKSSQNFLYRDFLRNLWYDEKKVWVAITQTPEEIIALQDVQMLNAGVRVIPRPETDVHTALLYLKNAKPWLNTEIYKMKLLEMYTTQQKEQRESGVEPETNGTQEAMQNNIAAQAGAGLQNMAQQFTW